MFGSGQIAGQSCPITNFVYFTGVGIRFFIFGFSAIMGRKFSKFETVILLCDISVDRVPVSGVTTARPS